MSDLLLMRGSPFRHGDEAHTETYVKEGEPISVLTETLELKIMTADERDRLSTLGGIPI